MSAHECRAPATAHGTLVIRGNDGHVDTVEFRDDSQEYGEFSCTCGAEFDTREAAEEHVQDATR